MKEVDRTHGSRHRYFDLGCRCSPCVEGVKRRRRERIAAGIPDHIPHGASRYSNWGCRCDTCRLAKLAEERRANDTRKANIRNAARRATLTRMTHHTAAATASTAALTERNSA
ncbi:hypothetical protein ACWEQ4_01525 [Rhodococcus sp. NPDC003994]